MLCNRTEPLPVDRPPSSAGDNSTWCQPQPQLPGVQQLLTGQPANHDHCYCSFCRQHRQDHHKQHQQSAHNTQGGTARLSSVSEILERLLPAPGPVAQRLARPQHARFAADDTRGDNLRYNLLQSLHHRKRLRYLRPRPNTNSSPPEPEDELRRRRKRWLRELREAAAGSRPKDTVAGDHLAQQQHAKMVLPRVPPPQRPCAQQASGNQQYAMAQQPQCPLGGGQHFLSDDSALMQPLPVHEHSLGGQQPLHEQQPWTALPLQPDGPQSSVTGFSPSPNTQQWPQCLLPHPPDAGPVGQSTSGQQQPCSDRPA